MIMVMGFTNLYHQASAVYWPLFAIAALEAIVASLSLISATFSVIKQSVVRTEINWAKLELLFELQRTPTDEERVGISPKRYHKVKRVSKPIISLDSQHLLTQEELINGITDVDGVEGDKGGNLLFSGLH
ncbi:unnamed protein product [Fraxinus pennsylvanica]|uniref:Uncharacterized protein n=1 Tax=Fraxinus pennsylvanica TaxID=56036 RepID=A0AAD1ZDU5_9LAMI|nr:unnamed protein product [Fraxinus pennsylvanica]